MESRTRESAGNGPSPGSRAKTTLLCAAVQKGVLTRWFFTLPSERNINNCVRRVRKRNVKRESVAQQRGDYHRGGSERGGLSRRKKSPVVTDGKKKKKNTLISESGEKMSRKYCGGHSRVNNAD